MVQRLWIEVGVVDLSSFVAKVSLCSHCFSGRNPLGHSMHATAYDKSELRLHLAQVSCW
jgi:hypothetical protein